MTKAAFFDAVGQPTAFYDPTFQTVPEGAVEISDEQWQELLAGGHYWTGSAVAVFVPPLDDIRAAKLAELTAACAGAIMGGYASAALGVPHTYPCKLTDQANMQASVIRSLLPGLAPGWTTPFWCADEAGEWARRDHTAAQIQQAGQDGVAHVLTQQDTLASLAAAVAAASTAEAIAAIVWTA